MESKNNSSDWGCFIAALIITVVICYLLFNYFFYVIGVVVVLFIAGAFLTYWDNRKYQRLETRRLRAKAKKGEVSAMYELSQRKNRGGISEGEALFWADKAHNTERRYKEKRENKQIASIKKYSEAKRMYDDIVRSELERKS